MRLNNKGFAISGILYSMFILVITLMFLVLGILAGRRTVLNRLGEEAADAIESRRIYKVKCTQIKWNQSTLYSYDNLQKEQEVKLSEGYYLIQAWGGSGAKSNEGDGGKGAYAATIFQAETGNTKLYLNIGDGGDNILNKGSNLTYNGGGKGSGMSGSGGGATSVATHNGVLKDNLKNHKDAIILVAAGGGGAGKGNGGAGGNLSNGLDGEGSGNGPGAGATKTSGGTGGVDIDNHKSGSSGSFGVGGDAGIGEENKTQGGGGGGGYYGGGGAAASDTNNGGGGGGLSYIDDELLNFTKAILRNSGIFTSEYKMYIGVGIDGNHEMPDTHESTTSSILTQKKVGNVGPGYVRITPLVCS